MLERTHRFALLTQEVDRIGGEDQFLDMLMSRIAEGEAPSDICRSRGLPWITVRRWLEDRPERMKEWELAKRAYADGLMWEGLSEVREATVEDVAVARLRSETYHKTAGKMSKVEWGGGEEGAARFGMGGITVVIGDVLSARLAQPNPDAERVIDVTPVVEEVVI